MPLSDDLRAEIKHVADMGMTERESLPLLRELAQTHGEKKYRVRACFRIHRRQPPPVQRFRILGEPGVDARAGEDGIVLGYTRETGEDRVRMRFADGAEELFPPHQLVPAPEKEAP